MNENLYDKNYPLDTTIVKDLPKAIREKGNQIMKVVEKIETNRTTSSIAGSINTFPFFNQLFINQNDEIPSGIYFNRGDCWVGHSNLSFLPSDVANIKIGTRITIYNKTYELKENENIKIWVESFDVRPLIFFDFFEFLNTNTILNNRGFGPSINLECQNVIRKTPSLPYIETTKTSKINTLPSVPLGKTFTLTGLFKNIKRNFEDNELIDINHNAIIIYIKDEFSNINFGLSYDKSNNLQFFKNEEVIDLNIILSENKIYQISLFYHDNTLKVILDDEEISEFNLNIDNLKLLFSFANDNGYGRYANGSFTLSDICLFKEILTREEIMWLKLNPRNWNFYSNSSFLDLTLEEKIKLKEMLK